MRLLLILAGCVFLGVFCGASASGDDKEKKSAEPEVKITGDDAATISTALQHFSEQEVTWAFDGRELKKAIVINDKSAGPSWMYLSDGQMAEVKTSKWEVPVEIGENLRQRNKKPVSFGDAKFGKVVIMGDLKKLPPPPFGEFPKEYADAKAWAQVWLPGYSKDGTTAIVRFWFGPTAHGATATYLLNKEDGWKVIKWHFSYYA